MDRVISQVYLKDTHYRIYGQLNIYADGWQEVKQVPGYSIKGYYNPEKNWTTDVHGHVVSQGNTLAALVRP